MKLVHFADTHLGFRSGQRLTPTGINAREADVARTFTRLIDAVIAIAPDVVVIGGDVFHESRPSNAAIVHAFAQFTRLTASVPGVIVVLVAGNHDLPRVSSGGDILPLLGTIAGVHVVDRVPRRLWFPDRSLSILGVPDAPGVKRPELAPDPAARFNVLCMHGEVQGMPGAGVGDRKAAEISQEELGADRWDYVALGHYHVTQQIAPNCWYSGSIDYTSTNIWGELAAERDAGYVGKGFLERDLETGVLTRHELAPARPVIDVPRFDARGMTVEQLDAAIAAAVDTIGIDDAIARLVVDDVDRVVQRSINHRALRSYRRRAFDFTLDLRIAETPAAERSLSRRLAGMSVRDILVEALNRRDLANDVDRAELAALGNRYLEEANEKVGDRAAAEPISIERKERVA